MGVETEGYVPQNEEIEPDPLPPVEATPEQLLWQRAEQLAQLRAPLTQRQLELYEQVEAMRAGRLNLHQQETLANMEDEYWRVGGTVQEILQQEDDLVAALVALEEGTLDAHTLQRLLPPPAEDTEKVSKRKQRLREEKARMGMDPREIDYHIYAAFGAPTTRLTTGHNQRRLRGSFDTESARGEFFDRTIDTHGGKVSNGKDGQYYTTANGRKVRKK